MGSILRKKIKFVLIAKIRYFYVFLCITSAMVLVSDQID